MTRVQVTALRADHAGQARRRPAVPQELKDVAAAHAAKHPNDPQDMGYTGVSFLEKGSLKSVVEHAAALEDAGNAIPVAANASLYQLQFSYHAARRREAWVMDPPRDGKLQMQVVLTPSWHANAWDAPEPKTAPRDDAPQAEWDAYDKAWDKYEKSCKANATKFALTNTYHFSVTYPDGSVDQKTFKVNGKEPEWASASPTIEIDLNKHKGDIVIRGWAEGSAGAEGFASARVTVLHNPAKP
ncbi:MAG: hypothetical protein FJ137_08015 [Deltaproteobacteria bacterium]|nr:hypothetical protein [Deltaproteobacteria bacterium]